MSDRDASYLIPMIGETAFGFSWPVDLADELEITTTSLRQWRIGRRRVPPGAWADMVRLLRRRRAEIEQAERELIDALADLSPELRAQIDAGTFDQSIDDEPSIDEAAL